MNLLDKFERSKIFIERHIIGSGRPRIVKKVYVVEKHEEPENLDEYFKRGLNAKRILKYKKDEYSFRWVVWYI